MTATTRAATPYGIPKKRIDQYRAFGGPDQFERSAAAAAETRRDLEVLRLQDRHKAAAVTASVLDSLVRRHCFILAMSSEEAALKIDALDSFLSFYEQEDQPLMAAMVEYARDFERRRWPAAGERRCGVD